MQNSMVVFTFSVLDQNFLFRTNFCQNDFSILDWKHTFQIKLAQKNQNCQFDLKFCKKTETNTQNSVVVITFSVLDKKHPFREISGGVYFFCFRPKTPFQRNLVQIIKICHFKSKFRNQNNLNMQNTMVMLTFYVLGWKYPFWANVDQKIKRVSLF